MDKGRVGREGVEHWRRELKGRLRPRGKEHREFPPSWHTLRCAGPDECQHVPLLLRLPSPSAPASASVSLCMFLKCQPCLCRLFCSLPSLLFAGVRLCLWVRVGVGRDFSYFLPSPWFVMSCFAGVHQKIVFFSPTLFTSPLSNSPFDFVVPSLCASLRGGRIPPPNPTWIMKDEQFFWSSPGFIFFFFLMPFS